MPVEPIDDILEWSGKLTSWKQDALRRLAGSPDISDEDRNDLLSMIKAGAGLTLSPSPEPVVFKKEHFGGGKHQPIVLKGIAKVTNVNRLVSNASLTFCPNALTVVFGRNGSGKSGFVRILRTACRTRIENPAKLKVLADVYGGVSGLQSAEIVVDLGAGDIGIPWSPGNAAAAELMQVAVFDTASAQIYVDGGNQIRYLPFGLALPHRLNSVCMGLKEKLEIERAVEVGNKVDLTAIAFGVTRNTKAQAFNNNLTKSTNDLEIDTATTFTEENQKRLDAITAVLSAGAAAAADVSALLNWTDSITVECAVVTKSLSDEALDQTSTLKSDAVSARKAAELAAGELFTDEPLPGVGGDTWRALWTAAREYSVKTAYPEVEFPVLSIGEDLAACVLCQQPLQADGAARMRRFQKYMDDTLDAAARNAERAVDEAIKSVPVLACFRAADFADRLEQVRKRDNALADAVAKFQQSAIKRREAAIAKLQGVGTETLSELVVLIDDMTSFTNALTSEKQELAKAGNSEERAKFVAEKAGLEDRKTLAANKAKLTMRRNLLTIDHAYSKAIAEVNTKMITQRANELLDTHLTAAVVDRFDAERSRFDIMHLNVGLARKSGKMNAEFQVDPKTTLTKFTSEILSEGEQRALALAGFLTEVALTDGSGPIVIDDPVSSLDRDRSVKVAKRIAEEATKRQVIVFTHDIVFFNELCQAADDINIEPVTIALFSDKSAAGKVDAAGMVWKGLNVVKRIGSLKNDSAPLKKILAASPAEYEYKIKGLYGRLRDTYERVVEEVIFQNIVRRGTDAIQTQLLRYVRLTDALAVRFYEGMTKANTYSHDNPAADTVPTPTPEEFEADIEALENLVRDLKEEAKAAEADRPQMKK
ncbi:AAA family ATPase [Rhizobium leguminosarum]|uniref:AAA family ATPase n=1 Tax=Rhizobium leguminosarum TaxID=384 RepID=UPI001C939821|nr:AAA family ATPase [Rhizobium leguminosarum]MBY5637719.1 AAA family ATPase [Rhizobium leguminosarum]